MLFSETCSYYELQNGVTDSTSKCAIEKILNLYLGIAFIVGHLGGLTAKA